MALLKAVLLDMDGTLVDSNDAHAQAWLEAFEASGFSATFEQVRRLIGMGGDKLIPEVSGVEADSDEGKQLSERRSKLFKKTYLPQIRPFPQVEALLARLHQAGLRLVLASSAKQDELSAMLEICGGRRFVHEATSSDDVSHSKPDPDILHAALAKAGCFASEAILLGDTPYDIEAGRRAGVRTVALRCGGNDDSSLSGAAAIYDDPADLLARFETSPLAGV